MFFFTLETLKRSFSREMGLHKLAVESDTEEIRSDRTGEETEEHSYLKYVFSSAIINSVKIIHCSPLTSD